MRGPSVPQLQFEAAFGSRRVTQRRKRRVTALRGETGGFAPVGRCDQPGPPPGGVYSSLELKGYQFHVTGGLRVVARGQKDMANMELSLHGDIAVGKRTTSPYFTSHLKA